MHYPLHITVLCMGLWVLQDDVNAAKTGVSAEVLTSFAKNVASILSSTLLSDFQDSLSNQSVSYLGSLKKPPETHSVTIESIKRETSEATTKASLDHLKRLTKRQSVNEGGGGEFQDFYVANDPRYSNHYNPEFGVNRGGRIPPQAVNLGPAGNLNGDTRENSIDADTNAASFQYPNQYNQQPDFRYNPDLGRPLDNLNHHGQFGFHPNYQEPGAGPRAGPAQPVGAEGVLGSPRENENVQPARITHNFNYPGPFQAPHNTPSYTHPGFFNPHSGPVEGGQPSPAGEQVEGNPSRLTDDQTQGQSAVAGYDYGPRFHYRPPYHDGFYGHPGFYPGPFNGSFNPAAGIPPGYNYTNGQFPFGPYPFQGPGFPTPTPDDQANLYGRIPQQAQNAAAPQQTSPENGQGNGNSTANGPPYGFPGYGPFHGGFHPLGYPLGPFNGLPYHHFNHGFHGHLYPQFKGIPYHHGLPYPHFPLVHLNPYGGFYPNHNGHMPAKMPENEKAAADEQSANMMPESPMNSDAEVISESGSSLVQSLPSNKKEKFLIPWPLAKGSDNLKHAQILNQLS